MWDPLCQRQLWSVVVELVVTARRWLWRAKLVLVFVGCWCLWLVALCTVGKKLPSARGCVLLLFMFGMGKARCDLYKQAQLTRCVAWSV